LGLDPNIILCEEVADFYLLMEMSLTDKRYEEPMYERAGKLAEQLCKYLELASLGEFRHLVTNRDWKKFKDGRVVGDVISADGLYHTDNRLGCWALWPKLYETLGSSLFEIMKEGFRRISCSSGIGGERWANCVEVAEYYRTGKVSDPVLFCDLAMGLKHNGDIAYNKFWDTHTLGFVLDQARIGAPLVLEHYASEEVLAMRGLRE